MRYWVYLNGEVPGSYEPGELAAFPGFSDASMVCPAEGGYEVRNWRRAGEFPDIASALRGRDKAGPALPAPLSAVDAVREPVHSGTAKSADDILNDASARIFRHVSELMKELDNRREERALTQSLQRQAAELRNELLALRERNKSLQDRADLIPGYEESIRKLQDQLSGLTAELSQKERLISEAEQRCRALSQELQGLRLTESKVGEDLKHQVRLGEELSAQLAAKEFTLAKSFALIRRLEAEISGILPGALAGIRAELPEYPRERPQADQAPPPSEPEIPIIRAAASPEPEPAPPPEPEAPGPDAEEPAPVRARAPEAPAPTVEEVPEAPPAPGASYAPGTAGSGTVPAGPSATADGDLVVPPGESAALPPEGEVRPVPAPWQSALKRAMGQLKDRFARKPPAGGQD